MMNPPASGLDAILHEKFIRREARAELVSCALFCGAGFAIFALLTLLGDARTFKSFHVIREAFLSATVLFIALALLARKGWWHPSMRYVNTGLQVTLVSFFLATVARERGPSFALSTALPMLYCLVISITAFRLSPWLSFFAGALAAAELALVYALVMRPLLAPEMIESSPVLAWPGVMARGVVLLAIGAACSLAARALNRQIHKQAEDQSRIQLLERTFGRLVAPEVARQILEDENWMRPARREAVVMFADLKGFTKYAEGRTPEAVADFLNRCWSVAADIVESHGGVINKYMGDGFLAIFGVPLELAAAERAAAQTATELQEKLTPILEPENLSLCIGVHAGPMIVGGIGSESRCEFTVIGSTVNLASRLETLNRSLETRCLTSEAVAGKIAGDWDMTDRGSHAVKGIAGEVSVFELGEKRPPAG